MSGIMFASFTLIIGKTTLLNLRILGLQQCVANAAINQLHPLTLADEISLAIQELAGHPEVMYFSELHCAMFALPGLLLYNVDRYD